MSVKIKENIRDILSKFRNNDGYGIERAQYDLLMLFDLQKTDSNTTKQELEEKAKDFYVEHIEGEPLTDEVVLNSLVDFVGEILHDKL